MPQSDPTHTTMIRRRIMQQANRRFRKLRGKIREEITQYDVLSLDLVDAFMNRLDRMTEQYIFGTAEQAGVDVNEVEDLPSWVGTGLDQAFSRGIRDAVTKIQQVFPEAGVDIEGITRKQAVQRRRETMRRRALEELTNATGNMKTQIRRELVAGIEAGISPYDMASRINDRVSKVGNTRARTIARTETVRAHHKAQMGAYREAEADGVKVQAEWNTAGDARVCPECQSLEGRVFRLDDIENMIPLHPNCRCAAIPHFEDRTGRA